MIDQRFMFNGVEYVVWDECGSHYLTGEMSYQCRSERGTIYLPESEIRPHFI